MIITLSVPLYEDSSYTYVVDLQQDSYELTFHYNVRMESWYMDISLAQGDALVRSVKLVPYHELCQNYQLPGLTGYFWLQPIGDSLSKFKEEPLNLSKWFELLYVYDDGEEV